MGKGKKNRKKSNANKKRQNNNQNGAATAEVVETPPVIADDTQANGADTEPVDAPVTTAAAAVAADTKENTIPETPAAESVPVAKPVAEPVAKPIAKPQPPVDNSIPAPLQSVFQDLTPKQQVLVKLLCSPLLGQAHIFENWSKDGKVEAKLDCVKQLEKIHEGSPIGLMGFITNARKQQEKKEVEPVSLTLNDSKSIGFAYVDEGKNGLLQSYANEVLNTQKKYTAGKMSLCIITSSEATISTLEKNNYYGIDKDNVSIVQPEKLPVLDAKMKLVMKGYTVQTELVGSQDAFFSSKVIKDWAAKGIEWVSFLDVSVDAISGGSITMDAYRLESRAPAKLTISKPPPPVELVEAISDPVPAPKKEKQKEKQTETKTDSKTTAKKTVASRSAPSMSVPADDEKLQKAASDECGCVIL